MPLAEGERLRARGRHRDNVIRRLELQFCQQAFDILDGGVVAELRPDLFR
jgi:hypothetical protein